MVKQSDATQFNDALIALSCQLRGFEFIASFDPDFDHHAPWLKRIAQPDQFYGTASDLQHPHRFSSTSWLTRFILSGIIIA